MEGPTVCYSDNEPTLKVDLPGPSRLGGVFSLVKALAELEPVRQVYLVCPGVIEVELKCNDMRVKKRLSSTIRNMARAWVNQAQQSRLSLIGDINEMFRDMSIDELIRLRTQIELWRDLRE